VKTVNKKTLHKDERCKSIEDAIKMFAPYIISEHSSGICSYAGLINVPRNELFGIQIDRKTAGSVTAQRPFQHL